MTNTNNHQFKPPLSARRELAMLEFIDMINHAVKSVLKACEPELLLWYEQCFQRAYQVSYSTTQLDIMLQIKQYKFDTIANSKDFKRTVNYIAWNASNNPVLWERHILYAVFSLVAQNANNYEQAETLHQEALRINNRSDYVGKLFGYKKNLFFKTSKDEGLYYDYLINLTQKRDAMLRRNLKLAIQP